MQCACSALGCSRKNGEYVLDLITEPSSSVLGVRFDSCTLLRHECLVLGQNEFNPEVQALMTPAFAPTTSRARNKRRTIVQVAHRLPGVKTR